MNIILVSGKLAKGKTVALSHTQVMTLGMALLAFPLLLAMAFTYLLLFHAADIPHPYLQSLVLSAQRTEAAKSQVYLRENLSAPEPHLKVQVRPGGAASCTYFADFLPFHHHVTHLGQHF